MPRSTGWSPTPGGGPPPPPPGPRPLPPAAGPLADPPRPDANGVPRHPRPDPPGALLPLRGGVRGEPPLSEKTRRKFAGKNPPGYSLTAPLDSARPADILAHLMVGSEG